MTLRIATEDDLLDVLILGRQFAREAKYDFDKDKTAETFFRLVNQPDGMVIIWEHDGEPVGFISGIITAPFLSNRKQCHEMTWFVTKEARGKGGAIKLMKSLIEWAESEQCSDIIMGDIVGLTDLEKLYGKMGFKMTEKLYTKEL